MKILVTGVHSTPAFAVIDELLSRKDYDIYYIGQKHSILFDKNLSAEYKVAQTKKVHFISLIAGKMSLNLSFSSVLWWLRIPIGYIHSLILLLTIKPDIILTFGSHVGVPIATAGHFLNIPVIAHEQTIVIGRATKIIQKYADTVCFSWKDQCQGEKFVFTGNPIRKEVFENNIDIEFADKTKKTVLFLGGNQGAHAINEALEGAVSKLNYNIILQSGKSSTTNDYERLLKLSEEINKNGIRFIVKDYIFPHEVGAYYHASDLVVCRSGGNTITEIAALGKVALCIPLPNSAGNEQYLHAKLLSDCGSALILEQKDLNSKTLTEYIDIMFKDYEEFRLNCEKSKTLVKLSAAQEISDIVEKYIIK